MNILILNVVFCLNHYFNYSEFLLLPSNNSVYAILSADKVNFKFFMTFTANITKSIGFLFNFPIIITLI